MLPGIICHHVGGMGKPALAVQHDLPDDDLSGWGVFCSDTPHPTADLRITDLDRYMNEPSLLELRNTLAEGQYAHRTSIGQPWVIEPLPPEPEEVEIFSVLASTIPAPATVDGGQ